MKLFLLWSFETQILLKENPSNREKNKVQTEKWRNQRQYNEYGSNETSSWKPWKTGGVSLERGRTYYLYF